MRTTKSGIFRFLIRPFLRLIGCLTLAAILAAALIAAASPALAATVSLSVTVGGGPINVSASATFINGETGTLEVFDHNNGRIGSASGQGSAVFTKIMDPAIFTVNGAYTFRAEATDSSGTSETTATFTIENPISITANTTAVPIAPLDVTGMAQFLDRPNSVQVGTLYFYTKLSNATTWTYAGRQYACMEPTVSYSLQNMQGGLLDVGSWANGDWDIKAEAYLNTQQYKEQIVSVTIENPISITASATSVPTGPLDVTGTAQFIERTGDAQEGTLYFYTRPSGATDWTYTGRQYACMEPMVSYSLQNMRGGLLDVGAWANGEWDIKAEAYLNAQQYKEQIISVTIENPISITANAPSAPTGPLDITGTAQFIERTGDTQEGTLYFYRRSSGTTSWTYTNRWYYCMDPIVSYSLQNTQGGLLDIASWANGDWDLKAEAYIKAQQYKDQILTITVDNTPKINASCTPYVSGEFDISGSVVFTETTGGDKGTLYINIDSQPTSSSPHKTYAMGDPADFSYAEIAGAPLNADTLGHGEHVAYMVAQAKNGTWSEVYEVPFRTGPPEADGSGNLKIVTP